MPLPSPYDAWFVAIVGAPPPEERSATCDACPMCDLRGFQPDLKCCTYIPPMANFRAGAGLKAGGDVAAAVRERMVSGRLTRIGILPTRAEERLYDQERGRFGQTSAVVCPFATGDGACRVWHARDVTCATWFCRHDAGAAGAAMWDAAADVLGLGEGLLAGFLARELDNPPSEAQLIAAAERAATFDWAAIRTLPGAEVLPPAEQRLREACASLALGLTRWAPGHPPPDRTAG